MVRHDLLYLWIMFLEKVCKTELRICGLLSEPFIKQEFTVSASYYIAAIR